MKKLFISCPMRGRTEENIKATMDKMHKIAEIMVGEELEVIPSYIEDNAPKDTKEAVWFLGESIKKMSQADYVVGFHSMWEFRGCNSELDIAGRYGIKTLWLDDIDVIAPDIQEVIGKNRVAVSC